MSNIVERSTWHTGKRHLKSGKAYDPGHNGNEKGRALQEHIDQSKFNKNIYYYLDLETGKMKRENGGHGGVDFKKIEREFAKKNFKEGLDNINERYRKSGHSEDVKTLTQYLNSKPPMEIISELGGVGSQIPLKERGEILVDATTKVMRIAQKTWPDNL